METRQFADRSAAIINLQERGYGADFIPAMENILCVQDSELISPQDFQVTESYLFGGGRSSRENYIICAVYALNSGLKGILMASCNAFGDGLPMYLGKAIPQHLKKIKTLNHANQKC